MSIRILSLQLINLISAGEIIDSPSAVVKELMENSLDAKATYISVYVQKGGMKSIIIKDNGCGMSKQDLILCIKNHSTSKIFFVEDLKKINSLGFRGEALASISAVSRITISTSTSDSKVGWRLYSENINYSSIQLTPISHPKGTSVHVLDLFYNVPVRRICLRTETSEFLKIKKIIKKIALSQDNITISLYHNNKLTNKYYAVEKNMSNKNRMLMLLGHVFMKESLLVELKFKFLKIKGRIAILKKNQSTKTNNYFYVNNRIVYSKVVNHAIRQAICQVYNDNYYLYTSVLYLNIPCNYININVHPNKKEIHFYELRIIHSFIYQAILNVLRKFKSQTSIKNDHNNWIIKNKDIAGKNVFSNFNKSILQQSLPFRKLHDSKYNFSKNIITIIKKRYVLIEYNQELALVSLLKVVYLLRELKLKKGVSKGLKIEYLSIPYKIIVSNKNNQILFKYKKMLFNLGFEISKKSSVYRLHTIPYFIDEKKIESLMQNILNFFDSHESFNFIHLYKIILKYSKNYNFNLNYLKIVFYFIQLEKELPEIIQKPPSNLLQKINLDSLICILK